MIIANPKPSNLAKMHESNRLSSCSSKIEQYGLEAIVREYRTSGDMSYEAIANKINQEQLQGMDKLSKMAVQRWCVKNKVLPGERIEDNATVNIYNQQCDMLQSLDQAMQLVEVSLDDYRGRMNKGEAADVPQLEKLVSATTRLIAQKQSLVNSIQITQEKIYNYMAVTKIITTVLEMVRQEDEILCARIKEKIREDPMLLEAFRRLKD